MVRSLKYLRIRRHGPDLHPAKRAASKGIDDDGAGSPTLQYGTSRSGIGTIVRIFATIATVSRGSLLPSSAALQDEPGYARLALGR